MRFRWAKFALAATMTVAASAPMTMVFAQQPAVNSMIVDINLKDADMVMATQMLTRQTGLQFVIQPSDVPYGRVTLRLGPIGAEEAIKYITQAAGAYFKRDENGVFIISRTPFPVVKPTEEAAPTAKSPRILRKIKMMKASSRDVYEFLLYGTLTDASRDFAEMRKFRQGVTPEVMRFAQTYRLSGQSDLFSPTGQRVETPPKTTTELGNDITLPGESAGQAGRGGAGGFGGQGGPGGGFGGGQGGPGGGFGGGGGQGGPGGGGAGNAQLTGGQGLVGESIDFISYDPTDNSLVVRGNEDDINRLQADIAFFDIAPKQVTIKVEYITTTAQLSRSFGMDWTYQRGSVIAGVRPGSFARSGDPVFINYASGNVVTRLRASLTEGNARVVTSPIVRTLNNQTVVLASTVQTWFFVNNPVITAGGTVVNFPQPIPLDATTQLIVRPRINGDGTITMFLTPQVSGFTGVSKGPDGTEIPNLTSQFMQVVVRVKDGETIVMGGLTTKADDYATDRIPVLGELPIIGQFFRSNRKNRTSSELLIFVTPKVLEDDETGLGQP